MRARTFTALTGAAAVACALAVTAPAQAQQSEGSPSSSGTSRPDNRPGPKSAEQAKKRAKALALLDNGKATLKSQKGGGATVTLTRGRRDEAVEFPVDKSDKVFTILAEFGDTGSGKLGTVPGPLHNEIPEPPANDNSTTGSTTSTRPTTRTCSTAPPRRSPTSTPSSPAGGTRRSTPSATGCRCPATPRPTATTRSRTTAARGPSSVTRPTPGTSRSWRPEERRRDRRLPLPVRRLGPLRLRR